MRSKCMTAEEAIDFIKSGDTVAISGFIDMGHPEEISRAVEERFVKTGEPHGLTLAYGASQSNPALNAGLNRWCKVEHVTFSGAFARERNLNILYVTERAVFEMRSDGLTLIEKAPGVDLEKDILGQMDFTPKVATDLKLMDKRIFIDAPMGIRLM